MKPFSNFKEHFLKIVVILSTIALGAFVPITGQMNFISTPCYEWAERNEATAEGIHQAVSAQARAGAALHMHIYPKGSKSFTELCLLTHQCNRIHSGNFQNANSVHTVKMK